MASTYQLYQEKKSGILSTFPFGIFGYARLDDRLSDSELWKNAPRQPGRDPMGLTPSQPNMEIWNTELYGGPKQYDDFPVDHKHAFAMCTLLFNQHSRGRVKLASADPLQNPIVDHKYLDDPLDMLVMSEACRFANEIVMKGSTTKKIIKGSWPANLTHHTYTKREDWESHVRKHATTCMSFLTPHVCYSILHMAKTNALRLPCIRYLRNGHPRRQKCGVGFALTRPWRTELACG